MKMSTLKYQAEDVYPSRKGTEAAILNRQDPVVYSQSEVPFGCLTEKQVHSYEQKGFLQVKGLFSPEEVDSFTRELNRLTMKDEVRSAPWTISEPDSGAVRSIFRIHDLSPVFAKLCRDPRILGVAQYLLNDDVYIHQSRVNLKPGFQGKEFYWHSDFETWHVEDGIPRMRAISVSIALTDNTPFNGPVMLIPGSHRYFISCEGTTPRENYKDSLKVQKTGVPDQTSLEHLVGDGGIEAPCGPAGSVLFFECNTMHGSNSNITPHPRSNAFFVYNAISNRVVDPFSGLAPRPEFIASRKKVEILHPLPKGD